LAKSNNKVSTVSLSISFETACKNRDYRHLSSIAGVHIDLRYAGTRNFVGRNLYHPLDCAWLHTTAATGLEQAVAHLALHAPGTHLLVLDALRPQRVQEQLWAALEGTTLTKYLANPQLGSIHSFGMAIDATLCDESGQEFDMGSEFDQMDDLSHPEFETQLLAASQLTKEHLARRELLRNALRAGGFSGIRSEWWHFDCGDKAWVRSNLPRIG
jgi:zinc D-Ala-D-Ala dipeptidase